MDKIDYNPIIEGHNGPILLEKYLFENYMQEKFVSYLEYDKNNKEFIRHMYALRKTKKKGCECQEVFREYESGKKLFKNLIYNSYGINSGTKVIWENKHVGNWYIGELKREVSFYRDDENDVFKFYDYVQLSNLEDIISNDNSLNYCKWNRCIDALNYIKQYKKHPIVEMLMKLELYHLVFNEKCILLMDENKSFCKWLFKNKDSIKNERISFQSLKIAFTKGYDISTYNTRIIDKRNKGRELSKILGKELYKFFKDTPFIDKALTYVKRVGQSNYQDYLEACKYLKLNFNDTKVVFPNDFQYWHDYYINQMETDKSKDIDCKILKQAKKYKFLLLNLETLTFIFPTKTQDFIDEGEALHHCVGRMGYNKKMANGESLIIFIRKKEDPNTPFITMEYNPKLKKINQLYGDHDKQPDKEIQKIIYNQWLPTIKTIKSTGRLTI